MSGLDWAHPIHEIGQRLRQRRTADASERASLTELLGESSCEALSTFYEIRTISSGRYRVTGTVEAVIRQICGVTLDPLHQNIEETFDVEFQSGYRPSENTEIDVDAFSDDDPEPIENNEIRIGRLLSEIVVSALDPFPRAPDAELEQTEAGDTQQPDNPFAALAALKRGET